MNTVNARRRLVRLMTRLGLLALLIVSAILVPLSASANSTTWRGEYYNNVNLTGAPVVVRDDANVVFDWGDGSPATGINNDRFSVRWTSYQYLDAGTYTFHATSDDGVRVWVDEHLIIDQWHDHPATTYSAAKALSTGYHSLRIEHYEQNGDAVCKVWWDTSGGGTTDPTISDWRGEYYNNTWLGGSPIVVRNDYALSFDWGYGSPAAGVAADNFSARWTRQAYFSTSGNYSFSVTVDDGVRVWVDNALVIDKWYAQSRTTHSGTVYLAAGNHDLRVEYFESGGVAVCMFNWSGGTPSAQEVIVDDRDSGFIWGGPTNSWYGRNTGYRGHLYWTWNSYSALHNWAKWFPYLPSAGNWEVYVYIASRYHGSKSARYSVYHSNGARSDVTVNQNNYYNQWVSLGTYYFSGGGNEYVYLDDATGETYATRFVGYDAVKFVKRDGVTPPPPGPVPTPPPPAPGCSIQPTLGFGRVWNDNSTVKTKLGCPTEVEKGVWSAEESFQGGCMFWRDDTDQIYVLYSNGTWTGYIDTWTSAEPEYDPSIVPPAGYYQPVRGFGKVWRENNTVRNGLGWATTQERGYHGSVQTFSGGTMLWSNVRGIYVLYSDGTWARYD